MREPGKSPNAWLEGLNRWIASLRARLTRKPSAPSPEALARGHEGTGVNIKVIVALGGLIILSAIVIHLALLLQMRHYERQADLTQGPLSPITPPEERFPAPRLQVAPDQDLRRLRESEDTLLGHYAWVDRSRGLIRIPIRRAMELLASPSATSGGQP